MQFTQLLFRNPAGRLSQQTLGALGLGKGDDITDLLCAGHHGHQAIEAEGDSAMGRGTVLEGVPGYP